MSKFSVEVMCTKGERIRIATPTIGNLDEISLTLKDRDGWYDADKTLTLQQAQTLAEALVSAIQYNQYKNKRR